MFELGLAGDRIDDGADQRSDTRLRSILPAPVDRRETHTARHFAAGADARNHRAASGCHARQLAVTNGRPQRVLGVKIDEGLGQVPVSRGDRPVRVMVCH